MKENEMPERIYLFDYNEAMVTPLEGDTVYVREDAFIKKAAKWINAHTSLSEKLVIENFVHYMEGE
jgi:hypothetical protein